MGSVVNQGALDRPRLWLLFAIIVAVGAIFTGLNIDLPIVRNSFSYAKGASALVENGFDVLAVAQDTVLTAGRPILFSLIAAPFVALVGPNAGTIIASAIGTVFFLCMAALCLQRLLRHTYDGDRVATVAFALTALNPLVIYQFWSAHPDSLFAGFILAALLLTDIIATEPARDTRWHIVGLAAVVFLAIHTKFYGIVLGLACPVYFLMNWRWLGASTHLRSKITVGAVAALLLLAMLVLAQLRVYPFLNLDSGMGVKDYAKGLQAPVVSRVLGVVEQYALATALAFHVALVFLFRSNAWRVWITAPAVFMFIYLAGLLTYPATGWNMRYLLPVFPWIAASIAMGASTFQPRARLSILSAYAVVGAISVLLFNSAPFHRMLQPLVGEALGRRDTQLLLDSLRLPSQLELAEQIDYLNRHLEKSSTLFWVSDYYGSATHGLGHELGLRSDIQIEYLFSFSQIPPSTHPTFVLRYGAEPSPGDVPDWARITTLRHSLPSSVLRLDPL